MKDGTDAVADWPILNALLNVASGASWVSFHHGGGVGIGNSLHAGQVIVADGTPGDARAPRARAHQRSGHRRRAPRRRGLRHRRARRRRAPASSFRWRASALLAVQALARPALPREVRVARCCGSARCSCTSRSRCAATRAAASATTGRRRPRRAQHELASFADAARHFNPMLVTFTGGEPLLRRDLEEIVAGRGRRGAAQVRHAHHARRHAHAGARGVALGRRHSPVQHLARLSRRPARCGARHSRPHGEDLPRRRRHARARHRQHPLQHRHQGRQPRSAHADRRARGVARLRRELQRLHRREERQPRPSAERAAARRSRRRHQSAARLQAPSPRRDHQLRRLPRADPAMGARRDHRAVPLRPAHDSHRSDGTREALPRFPDGLSLARLPRLRADQLQRVLLRLPRRGAGAAAALARARRDGASAPHALA